MRSVPSLTLINGEPADTVLVSERALQYGDGLFETISCVAGRPRWLERHLQRLCRGLDLDVFAGAIIVELLEQMEALRRELDRVGS